MIADSYIPNEQRAKFLRENIGKLGYVFVDAGGGYEQYCKCRDMKCTKDLKSEHFANLVEKGIETKKSEVKGTECNLPGYIREEITPPVRNLVTLFRENLHRTIGSGSLDISFINLTFVGEEENYQKILISLPELKEKHKKSKDRQSRLPKVN